ncbi:MAG: glycosyltransferase family 39 protein [Candidatus Thermoplasmatota archaeon]|nr:glycosyltransferase family 39 protein [Candidatus Thermoplasmatota archaeon]
MTRKTQILILTLLSIVFSFAYSSYLMGREVSFTTPDENVNLFYTRYVAENHSIVYEDALNESLDTTAIRPRGMRYQEGKVVPNLFFGMYFIYGGFQQVFGFLHLPDSAVLYLNPLFAVIGVWLLYFLVGEVFDEKTALISACLLFVLPPYWYWGSLFFSNILAVVLFIAALLFSFKALNRERPGFYALAGLFYGLTAFVRPDFVYLYPSVLVLILVRWRSIRIKYLGLAVLTFALSMAPLLLLNDYLYGGFLKTGQHVSLAWKGVVPPAGDRPDYLGENIALVLSAVPLSVFSFGGFIYLLRKRKHLDYLLLLPIPILLFGYFFLTGQPGRFDIIVHNSYVRYFVPIYVLMLPLFVIFLLRVVRKRYLVAAALLVFISFSVFTAYTGVLDTRRTAIYYAGKAGSIESQTESDAVIFCNSLDKILFPLRKVALYNFSEEAIDNAASLCSRMIDMGLPVYLVVERPSTTNLFSRLLEYYGCKMSVVDPANNLYSISKAKRI